MTREEAIIGEYKKYLGHAGFPCIAAKAALAHDSIKCHVFDDMRDAREDEAILQALYDFVDCYRQSSGLYHSAAIIFEGPQIGNEEMFDQLLWQKLESLSNLDREKFQHDPRVDSNPLQPTYSFSIKEEAFFIIGIHPQSNRTARRFKYPALVFNPHAAFEKLRKANKYEAIKQVVRKRDVVYSGSVNPMLKDFGAQSEVYQYSGMQYDSKWKCPLAKK
ncbi:MAG TPA: guanitoxin biosynthesis heme-dependent pre-guanitoxin N-hydroxylase GntA [Ohtaekwangia sp.]|nr:guanitoxin biosynthesis heme-dependent pre-guanitoxin N-hydroxylase GntA [Ohtaekwangia sp.]